jgi:pyruvate dehydrogenase E2 component (dihydrolipoamide acetyltransferase)
MIPITIPKLGLTMESAKLLRWELSSGSEVMEGQTILVIETDKVTYEVPAPVPGIVHPVAPQGKVCAVEEVVGYIAQDREEYDRISVQYPSMSTEDKTEEGAAEETSEPYRPPPGKPRLKASPLARAMAQEHGLDLQLVRGTGPGGRILRADILTALEENTKAAARKIANLNACTEKEIRETIPITGVRKIIFDNMHASLTQSAQLTLHTEACAEALVHLRQRLSRHGEKISYNAIMIKTAATALVLHPRMNASVLEGTMTVWNQIHIGLAMEVNDALVVPVVRRPDLKTISGIEGELKELLLKVQENRLSPDDLVNGTFTITNLGFGDIDYFTPIIRPPESAILGVGRIVRKPAVKADTVVPEQKVGLSLTFDHRIIDGAPAARFLKTIKDMIEDPLLLIR